MLKAGAHLFMVDLEGTELSEIERKIIQHPLVGSVILFTRNFSNLVQLEQLINSIRTINPDLFIAIDHEGGVVQRFQRHGFRSLPAARVYGDTYDLDPETGIRLARTYGELMASDLLAHGVDLSIAPVLDVHDINLVIARLDRAFHHDPDVIAQLAGAFIEGMNTAGMPAVGKHFPGHGSVSSDSHITMPVSHASMSELKAKDLKPFITLIENNLLNALMPAHVTYTAIDANKPAGFSTIWLQEILRKQLQFKGLVLSDCLSMTGADIGDLKTRVEEALHAGCDMLIVCHQPRELLLTLLNDLTTEQSPESAARIIEFKNRMSRFSKDKNPHQVMRQKSHDAETPISPNNKLNTTTTI